MSETNRRDLPVYTLFNSRKFESFDDCYKEMDNLYHMIMNFIKKNDYNDASFIIGISNIDSKTAKISYIRTGKRGRPRKEVLGEKIEWHIHLYVMCNKTSVSTFSNELRLYLQKKKHTQFKQKKNTLDVALPYVEKQCRYIRRYGSGFN